MDEFSFEKFSECPRCGDRSLEHLETYCHCPNCLYSADFAVELQRPATLTQIEELVNQLERDEEQAGARESDNSSQLERAAG